MPYLKYKYTPYWQKQAVHNNLTFGQNKKTLGIKFIFLSLDSRIFLACFFVFSKYFIFPTSVFFLKLDVANIYISDADKFRHKYFQRFSSLTEPQILLFIAFLKSRFREVVHFHFYLHGPSQFWAKSWFQTYSTWNRWSQLIWSNRYNEDGLNVNRQEKYIHNYSMLSCI